ncbi:MAG: DNA alkylation repair protein [Candidatus Omnitrophica bacterium]|nr:DNA alkylation repair protein [Candidatus Omnitrophota bacterium]
MLQKKTPSRTADQVRKALRKYASARKAAILSRFFKTGPGEYGAGDVFIGVQVPCIREVSRQYAGLDLPGTLELLHSEIHEERLLALCLWALKYERGDAATRNHIVRLYLQNTSHINNWDLVDLSAPKLLGHWLLERDGRQSPNGTAAGADPGHAPLPATAELFNTLTASTNLWERRIAIVSTLTFIRNRSFDHTFGIADRLLGDPADLLQKATGWMLREVGKRDVEALETFLWPRYARMPRTMLRYAIERFPEGKRQAYLKGTA